MGEGFDKYQKITKENIHQWAEENERLAKQSFEDFKRDNKELLESED